MSVSLHERRHSNLSASTTAVPRAAARRARRLVLGVATAVLLGLGVVLFARRHLH
jgi:hypothetical protein